MRNTNLRLITVFALGFSCMRAWALTFLGNSGVTPPLSLQLSSSMFFIFAPLIILTMVVIMVFSVRSAIDILAPHIIAATAVILTVGTLLLMGNGAATSVVAEAICAVGFGIFLMQWGECSSRIPIDKLIPSLSIGFVAAGFLCFVLCLLPTIPAHIFFASFIPVSTAMLYLNDTAADPQEKKGASSSGIAQDHKTPTRKPGILVRLCAAMFIMELVARSALMLSGEYFTSILSYPSSSFEFARLVGTALASTLFIIVARRTKTPLRILYALVPVFIVCSCLFLLSEGWGIPFVTYAIAFSAGAWLETAFWVFFSHLNKQTQYSSVMVWGFGRIAFWASTFVGLFFWSYQSLAFPGGIIANTGATTTLIIAMALGSMIVYLFVLPEKMIDVIGITGKDAQTAQPYHPLEEVTENISNMYGLSKREREVFYLLAKGRDTVYIQKQLFISSGTVCSHRDRIYRKLDIHSRQELLDLVEISSGA